VWIGQYLQTWLQCVCCIKWWWEGSHAELPRSKSSSQRGVAVANPVAQESSFCDHLLKAHVNCSLCPPTIHVKLIMVNTAHTKSLGNSSKDVRS
jgi:hypothetical protein